MKELKKGFDPSPSRIWYNDWVSKNVIGSVLDIGKSKFWDYSDTPYSYKSLDINESLNPDLVTDICDNTLCSGSFDFILCNGMYEFVSDPQKMVDEVYRILDKGGTAIFGFVGKDYKPYKKNRNFYEDNIDFKEFKILEKKDFNNKYHYIICTK